MKNKVIITIPVGDNIVLWVYGINVKEEIVYKSSLNMGHIKSEPYTVHDGVCYLGAYFFSTEYLNKLPQKPIDL